MAIISAIILICVTFMFFTFLPGNTAQKLKDEFYGFYFADNATLSNDDTENSKESIQKCLDMGIGLKIPVRLTKDAKVIIFNDENLLKRFNVDKTVSDMTLLELQEFNLLSLEELLDLVKGQSPLLLDLRSGHNNERLCNLVAEAISNYEYINIGVVSFHSGMLAWFKRFAKNMYRGIISAPSKAFIHLSAFDKFTAGNLMNNSICRPHFVLYRNGPESHLVKYAYMLGIIRGVFSVDSEEEAQKLMNTKDMIVISSFTPSVARYKEPIITQEPINQPVDVLEDTITLDLGDDSSFDDIDSDD